MHNGQISVLMQFSEFIIIGGAGLGSMLVGNPPRDVLGVFKTCLSLIKGSPYKKSTFTELTPYALTSSSRQPSRMACWRSSGT